MNQHATTAVSMCLLLASSVSGGERGSTHYEMPTDSLDSGGATSAAGAYSHSGSLGGITGVSTVNSPVQTAKAGYMGQLYEVVALEVAGAASVNETGSTQLSVAQILDDDSTLAVATIDATWSVDQGPLAGVDSTGLATADVVYADTVATAQADYAGLSDTWDINVLDTVADNYGTYASDGLGDDWQVQYFGFDNPDAAPTEDPDGDQQGNEFEYTAGLIPTDANSFFAIRIEPVSGQPAHKAIIFDPLVSGRTYIVKSREFLNTGSWQALSSSTSSDLGDERTVTDTGATADTQFYTVEIVKNP